MNLDVRQDCSGVDWKMKTGMARFNNRELMQERGFTE